MVVPVLSEYSIRQIYTLNPEGIKVNLKRHSPVLGDRQSRSSLLGHQEGRDRTNGFWRTKGPATELPGVWMSRNDQCLVGVTDSLRVKSTTFLSLVSRFPLVVLSEGL